MSARLAATALGELIYLEIVGLGGFSAVQRCVSRITPRHRTSSSTPSSKTTITTVVKAMKTACAFYFRTPPCLQRSAVVTRMLRRRGIDARLVIGCHMPPLRAHAWVEVAGEIVSDHQNGLEYFRVLDRW